MRTYMAAMQWAYSLPIGNRVQHLSAASMGTLPHLRKSFANGLREIRPLLMTDAMHLCCAKVGPSVPCQWCCKTRQTSIAELRLALKLLPGGHTLRRRSPLAPPHDFKRRFRLGFNNYLHSALTTALSREMNLVAPLALHPEGARTKT